MSTPYILLPKASERTGGDAALVTEHLLDISLCSIIDTGLQTKETVLTRSGWATQR